jgi:hypothetical protein
MTNLKNTATTIALAAVLMVGTASANTEITNQNAPQQKQCTVKDTNGIIGIVESFIKGFVLRMPRIFYAAEGVFDNKASSCTEHHMLMPKIRL